MQLIKATAVLGFAAVVSAKRIDHRASQASLSVEKDPLAGLKSCFDVPNYANKCKVSKSPGACYAKEDAEDDEAMWQCWNDGMAPETMTDATCKNVVGKAGACRFEEHSVKKADADLKPCRSVKGFSTQCHPVTQQWGACYKEESDVWMCFGKDNELIDDFRQGDCKVTPVNGESTETFDGVCRFAEVQETIYKCDTVATYNKSNPAQSCSGREDMPMACFSLEKGVTWQCHEDTVNPSCKSTAIPDGESETVKTYDGSCLLPDMVAEYEEEGLETEDASDLTTTTTTTMSTTPTSTTPEAADEPTVTEAAEEPTVTEAAEAPTTTTTTSSGAVRAWCGAALLSVASFLLH